MEWKCSESPYYKSDISCITWGFHKFWHGEIFRPKLNMLLPDNTIILLRRSFHELIANMEVIKALGISEEVSEKYPHDID